MRSATPLRLLTAYPVPMGIVVAALLLPAHFIFPRTYSVLFAAVTLVVIAAIYLAFAVRDGRRQALAAECSGFALYALAALVGISGFPVVIPLAIMAHAGWDLLHHNGQFGATIPSWYAPFCATVDILAGGALLFLFVT
ncbi:MAG: hypothetical protein AAFR20_00090 [Pseudomonadota bacterium]